MVGTLTRLCCRRRLLCQEPMLEAKRSPGKGKVASDVRWKPLLSTIPTDVTHLWTLCAMYNSRLAELHFDAGVEQRPVRVW